MHEDIQPNHLDTPLEDGERSQKKLSGGDCEERRWVLRLGSATWPTRSSQLRPLLWLFSQEMIPWVNAPYHCTMGESDLSANESREIPGDGEKALSGGRDDQEMAKLGKKQQTRVKGPNPPIKECLKQ